MSEISLSSSIFIIFSDSIYSNILAPAIFASINDEIFVTISEIANEPNITQKNIIKSEPTV